MAQRSLATAEDEARLDDLRKRGTLSADDSRDLRDLLQCDQLPEVREHLRSDVYHTVPGVAANEDGRDK
jgi:uncharacterized protein YgfB (UPF0149 family)